MSMRDADIVARLKVDASSAKTDLNRFIAETGRSAAGIEKALSIGDAPAKSARATGQAFRELLREQEQLERRTIALKSAIDPAFAAQDRFNREVREAKDLLDRGAIELADYSAAHTLAKQRLDASTQALQRSGAVSGQVRASMANLGQQVGDIAQGFAMGTPPVTIFAQQMGQVAYAASGLGGRIGAVATFLSGPWGAALTGTAVILAALAASHDKAGEAADRQGKKVKSLKDRLAELEQQAERTRRSVLGAAEAEARAAAKAADDAVKEADKQVGIAEKAARKARAVGRIFSKCIDMFCLIARRHIASSPKYLILA